MEDVPDFVTGKIKSLLLENFMTYEVVKFYPKEHLNVILGPNGTGKSTLVSAILIGMGGDFKKIGRATNLKDYIKYGQDKASIVLTLYQNEARATTCFQRVIDKNGRSLYKINDRPVDEARYLSLIRRFNIQVDNLCQFLPQDRVQDFALMNPHEILINTQKSVLPVAVCEKFDKLLELESFSQNASTKIERLRQKIAVEEEANNRLKPVVERMNVRNAIAEKLQVAYVKQKWLQRVSLEKNLAELHNDQGLAENRMNERMNAVAPIKEALKKIMRDKEVDRRREEQMKQEVKAGEGALRSLESEMEREEHSMMDATQELQLKRLEIEQRKEDERKLIEDRLVEVASIVELERNATPASKESEDKLQNQLQLNRRQKNDLLSVHSQIGSQIDDNLKPQVVALETRLTSMRNLANQRLEALQQRNKNLYDAVKWVRENRNKFEGVVYEPMMLTLNVKKREYIPYVENTVSLNDMMAFTCERTQDTLFMTRSLHKLGLRVNVLYSEAASKCLYTPDQPIQQLNHLGLHSYLLNWLDGPPPILNYLCKMYSVHNIPVGDDLAAKKLPQIQAKTNFHLMFIKDMRLATIKSAYSSERVRITSNVQGKDLLQVGIDENAVREQEMKLSKLKGQMDELRNKRADVERKISELEELGIRWSTALKDYAVHRNQIKMKNRKVQIIDEKLRTLREQPSTYPEYEREHRARLVASAKRLLQKQQTRMVKLEQLMQVQHKLKVVQRAHSFRDVEMVALQSDFEAARDELEEFKRLYDQLSAQLKNATEELRSVTHQLEQMTDNHLPNSKSFPHKAVFRKLPEELEALQGYIAELRTQIECMEQDDETLFMQYENRKKLIMELKEQQLANETRATTCCDEMKQLHEAWYPAITEMVATVNENFQNFMSSIGVVGEVEIIANERNAYSEFGIGIRVKYRDNGPFLILDRYHHSGGERAVAIATYTLALQKISQVPFRCVDEINQGMDPDNERKIFDMIVQEAAKPGMAQYFFVSPKFQPNVKANRYTTFHIVDSGKYLADADVFNNSSSSTSLMVQDD